MGRSVDTQAHGDLLAVADFGCVPESFTNIKGDFPLPWWDKLSWSEYKEEFLKWLGPLSFIKDDILAGIGVTLTLVPEAIAFAIMAKVFMTLCGVQL